MPNLGRGGAQQVFRDQLKFLSAHYNTMGCVFNWDDTFQDDHMPNIVSINVPAGKNWLSKIYFFWRRVYRLRKIKKNYNIDFSVSHLEGADYVNLLSKRKEKVICWIHGTKKFDQNIEGALGFLRKKILIPFTYKFSDLIVAVSEGIRQELIKDFGVPSHKVKTIYNGVDLKDISFKAAENLDPRIEDLFASSTVLITHCRLSRQKNLLALIDTFQLLKNQPDTKLMILGDGELRDALLQHCNTLNLAVYSVWNVDLPFNTNYSIYFLGYERNPYPYLRRASLYLLTSSWEGFPLSLCEAMACDIPILASDCYTGPREIIAPELTTSQPINEPAISSSGVLMPLINSGEAIKIWSTTIKSILDNGVLRKQLKRKGKERIQDFDKKESASQWLRILQ